MGTTATKPPDLDFASRRERPADPGIPVAIYVFELPVRLAHWTIFLAIVVLSVTGFWIGTPGGAPRSLEMQTIRFIHLVSGWTMLAAIFARVLWMFAGNRWASWREWVPSSWARVREIGGVLRFYFGLAPKYQEHGGGHNVLAGMSYVAVYALLLFMVLSGFALEGGGGARDWHALVSAPLAWIHPQVLRWLHHAGMWIVWIFVAEHVAIATLVDAETRGNTYSAIMSGWRPRCKLRKGGAK